MPMKKAQFVAQSHVPDGLEVGDQVEVFLYFDSDDLLIATTETPKAEVGSCALLKVIDTNRVERFFWIGG